jgi:hypothetical protein
LFFAGLTVTFYASFVLRVSGGGKAAGDVGINGKEKDRFQPTDSPVHPYVIAESFFSEESVISIV